MEEKVTINRQEIITVDGLHYKQDHKLIGAESEPLYDDLFWMDRYQPTRHLNSYGVRYKWAPLSGSTYNGVLAECGSCGSSNIVYITRNFKDAIKAGFLKLVAPVKK